MVILGDFSPNKKSWYTNDCINFEGSKIHFLTFGFVFHQIINKSNHILNNSSSCIGLIFTTQTNLVKESGVHSSLLANFHHQLPNVKFDLNAFLFAILWASYGIINLEILIAFKGQLVILNVKRDFRCDVRKKELLFNETILNFIRNFIPHKTATCDDRDPP